MEAKTDRLDQLAGASRRTAADLESLRAGLASLQGRVEAAENHLAETQAAHARTAAELERVRHQLVQVDRLETRVSELRDELTERLSAQEQSLHQALVEFNRRLDADVKGVGRELTALTGRVREIEGLSGRLAAAVRGHGELASELNTLMAHIEAVAEERTGFDEALRQVEVRLGARLDGVGSELERQRQDIDSWQERIELQSTTVREARTVADEMRAQVGQLQQDQHEVAEAQRLWEARIDALLEDQRSEADSAWHTFLTQRTQEWNQHTAAHAAWDTRLDELAERTGGVETAIGALESQVADSLAAQTAALDELRHRLLAAVGSWSETADTLAQAVEADLPPEEQRSAIDARRQARRRAMRARRDARQD